MNLIQYGAVRKTAEDVVKNGGLNKDLLTLAGISSREMAVEMLKGKISKEIVEDAYEITVLNLDYDKDMALGSETSVVKIGNKATQTRINLESNINALGYAIRTQHFEIIGFKEWASDVAAKQYEDDPSLGMPREDFYLDFGMIGMNILGMNNITNQNEIYKQELELCKLRQSFI